MFINQGNNQELLCCPDSRISFDREPQNLSPITENNIDNILASKYIHPLYFLQSCWFCSTCLFQT